MRNQIASIGINQSEETYLLAPKSLYKGEPLLSNFIWVFSRPKILLATSKCLGLPNQPGSTMIEFKGEEVLVLSLIEDTK